jgi:hypothetical protein
VYQIIQAACIHIAAKVEGDDERAAYGYSKGKIKKAVLKMENVILNAIDFDVIFPSLWLRA